MGYELKIYVGKPSTVTDTFAKDAGGNWRSVYEDGKDQYKWYEANGETSHKIMGADIETKEAFWLGYACMFELSKVFGDNSEKLNKLNNSESSTLYYVYESGLATIEDCYGDLLRVNSIGSTLEALDQIIETYEHTWPNLVGCHAALKAMHAKDPSLVCVFFGH